MRKIRTKIGFGIILAFVLIITIFLAKILFLPSRVPEKTTPPEKTSPKIPEVPTEVENEIRSKEVINPNGRYTAYIEPFEWEVVGNLFIKNKKTSEIKQLTKFADNSSTTVKFVKWLNDTLLLVIEGYTWGTCTVGGSLFIINSETGHHKIIVKADGSQEVADVAIHNGKIIANIATWDTNHINYKLSTQVISVDSILHCFAKSN